jgi:hypothetical protein
MVTRSAQEQTGIGADKCLSRPTRRKHEWGRKATNRIY